MNPSQAPESLTPDGPHCAIGLDVGGTKISGGIVTPSGRVRAERVIPTLPKRGGEPVLRDTLTLAEGFLEEARAMGLTALGIGVSVAELVDLEGNVTSEHTIAWRGLPVRARFSRLAPTVVEADTRAAARGEAVLGAGQPFRLFLYVTVGTGIGSSLVEGGRPYRGARGSAGTLASSPLSTICTECGTVLKPILEEIASGPALLKRYNQRGHTRAERAQDVLRLAAAGDPVATEVVRLGGEALGSTVGLMVNVLDPEAVIVGGGLGAAGGLYWESFIASTRDHIWSDTNSNLPILQAAHGANAGFIGAAAMILHSL